jgi:hypothetical protein
MHPLSLQYPSRKLHCTIHLKMDPIPCCASCHQPLRIITHSKPRIVEDRHETLNIITYYYGCRREKCHSSKRKLVHAPNPIASARSSLSIDMQISICRLRWKYNKTYQEIQEFLRKKYHIYRSLRGIELVLKEYEQSASATISPSAKQKIIQNGRMILSIDGIKPFNGEEGIYGVYDLLSNTPLASGRLLQQSEFCITNFLNAVKTRLHKAGIDVPIVATISDALVGQRLSLEKTLIGTKICLCHYHFYELVLKDARQCDTAIVTKLRSALRRFYYLEKYKRLLSQKIRIPWSKAVVHFLDLIFVLSNRKSRLKDHCFISPEYMKQCQDLVDLAKQRLNSSSKLSKTDRIVFEKFSESIAAIISQYRTENMGILKVRHDLEQLKEILNADETADQGETQLSDLCKTWEKSLQKQGKCADPIEKCYLDACIKFIRTKGRYLLNYRRVPGAPKTNNRHEQRFHRIKYKLRRIIGHVAAKDFLFKHGNSILFVDPDASEEEIREILMNAPIAQIRKKIREERKPRNSFEECIYDQTKWDAEIDKLRKELGLPKDLKKRLT